MFGLTPDQGKETVAFRCKRSLHDVKVLHGKFQSCGGFGGVCVGGGGRGLGGGRRRGESSGI